MKTMLFYVTIAVILVAGTLNVFGQDKAEAPTTKMATHGYIGAK
jgi:hypothetical protein